MCIENQSTTKENVIQITSEIENLTTQQTKQNKLPGLSPRANYTDRATAHCRRSYCQQKYKRALTARMIS
jgi:hypothetical protein